MLKDMPEPDGYILNRRLFENALNSIKRTSFSSTVKISLKPSLKITIYLPDEETGVGKTKLAKEIAKAVARKIYTSMIKYGM